MSSHPDLIRSSVTRFGKIRHLGKVLNDFGKFERVHYVFGNILNIFWQNPIGQSFNVVNGQILKM